MPNIYDNAYFQYMESRNIQTAKIINTRRWNMLFNHAKDIKTVLDYGSGLNLLSQFAPNNICVDSYDVGQLSDNTPYPQTGIQHEKYDAMFLCDVIEHVDWINHPDENILKYMNLSNYIYISLPVLPPNQDLKKWKHYKPGEHLTIFTENSIKSFVCDRNFDILETNYIECPPRQDIISLVVKNVK